MTATAAILMGLVMAVAAGPTAGATSAAPEHGGTACMDKQTGGTSLLQMSTRKNVGLRLQETEAGDGQGGGVAAAPTVRLFYHIFKGGNPSLADNIVKEQMLNLHRASPKSFEVDFTTIGTAWDMASINASGLNCPTCYHRAHYSKGWEILTLQKLYEYCVEHPTKQVAYMHSKGSYHNSKHNTVFRRFLMKGIASEECVNMPARCDVCSSHFSPLPHPHSPGNMWHAKCSHILRLQPPKSFAQTMDDFVQPQVSASPWGNVQGWNGAGRYAAEHWVHSHPDTEPCDLYAGAYSFGYGFDASIWYGTWLPQVQIGIRRPLWLYSDREPHILNRETSVAWVKWRCTEWRTLYKKLPTNFSKWRVEEALQKLALLSLDAVDVCSNPAYKLHDG